MSDNGVDALRALRKDYPDLWELLLRWDTDSPVSFKSGGITVHDYDKRFMMEEKCLLPVGKRFRGNMSGNTTKMARKV